MLTTRAQYHRLTGFDLSCAKIQQQASEYSDMKSLGRMLGFELNPALIVRHGDISSEPGTWFILGRAEPAGVCRVTQCKGSPLMFGDAW